MRDSLTSETDSEKMREDIDLLLNLNEELVEEVKTLKSAVRQLAERLSKLEEEEGKGKEEGLFRWF